MMNNHLDQVEVMNNPEPRCPIVLLLDTSASMGGQPIGELNEGLKEFATTFKGDQLISLRVELAVITFGGSPRAIDVRANTANLPFDEGSPFVLAGDFLAPVLSEYGDTPMGVAVSKALDLLRTRKDYYKRNGLDYYRPLIFLVTDGRPTDKTWEQDADRLQREESSGSVLFYAVGVEGADMSILSKFSRQRPPLKLKGLAFVELFQWLSKSLAAVSQSRPSEQVSLPPIGWGQLST